MHTLRSIVCILVLMGVLVGSGGCAPAAMQQGLQNAQHLAEALTTAYGAPANVTVVNDHIVRIAFVNSSYNALAARDRQTKAHEMAVFAQTHYAAPATIDDISVSFVIEYNYIVFHYTNGLDTYDFQGKDLHLTP